MAFKDRLRHQRSKRFSNVSNDFSSKEEEMNSFSSDSQSDDVSRKKKVRRGFSTKRLMKESECFTVDNDHIYTCVRSPETDCNHIRKRKISEEIDDKPVKKRCFSKNAVMARLNRERKKKYVTTLETENESLRKEKSEINRIVEEQKKKMSVMSREIVYLKSLLANSKELVLILRNLKETTGLPVTSSIIHTRNSGIAIDSPGTLLTAEEDNKDLVEYQPRIRSVNSGNGFPILDKDINLASCSDNSHSTSADLENYPFHFENSLCDISPPLLNDEDSYFDFCSSNLNSDLEECFQLGDLSKLRDPQVGICLHVNQKKISVEVCSICSSKAATSFEGLSDGVFAGRERRRNLDEK